MRRPRTSCRRTPRFPASPSSSLSPGSRDIPTSALLFLALILTESTISRLSFHPRVLKSPPEPGVWRCSSHPEPAGDLPSAHHEPSPGRGLERRATSDPAPGMLARLHISIFATPPAVFNGLSAGSIGREQ
ncbi:hypothetical protein PsYK624_153620 [Phanerochaete sordida]|uniref:Uncharacterized protein n=1 Tax=Phanerochaete sordida TaxID=48140 RepID=A0A9P3LL22_9APHY|nr:hypothetical protein PsYK624_153620 [Phanerochaete sordida]